MVRGIALAVAGPALLLAALEAGMLVMAAVGEHPRWTSEPVNLSEAAAVRDNAEVARLIESGEDPTVRRPVRRGLIGERMEVTTLEAAALVRRSDLVDVLVALGVRPPAAEWLPLYCAARGAEDGDMMASLDAMRPDGVAIECPEAAEP